MLVNTCVCEVTEAIKVSVKTGIADGGGGRALIPVRNIPDETRRQWQEMGRKQ